MGDLHIDYDQFHRRLGLLYKAWKGNSDDSWKDVSSFFIVYGAPAKDNVVYQKSIALHDWLFGYELSDTLMLFTPSTLHIVTGKKKGTIVTVHIALPYIHLADLLQPLTKKDDSVFVVPLNILVRSKEADPEHFKTLVNAALEVGPNAGNLTKEQHIGDFFASWDAFLKASALKLVDLNPGIASVLAVKDENELKFVKTAGSITASVLKRHFIPELERVIEDGVKIKHSTLAEKIDKLFQNPTMINPKLNPDAVEPCFFPIIQSGGKYDLRANTTSNDDELHPGTILVSLGARYKLYCSNMSRTFFIDPQPEQKANYEIMLSAYTALIEALVPGQKISAAYNAAAECIQKAKPELLAAFQKSCGFGLGLEFRDSSLLITAKNERAVRQGMVFNVSLGLHNLQLANQTNELKKTYSLLVANTVIIGEKGAETVTSFPTGFDDVSYSLEEEVAQVKKEVKPKKEMPVEAMGERRLREKEKDRAKESNEQKRKEHQEELALKKRQEAEQRFKKHRETHTGGEVKASVEDANAYKAPAEFPSDAVPHKIFVDSKHETVLLPVYGVLVPFHISYIKNASKTDEELRINFVAPGAPINIGNKQSGLKDNVVYIREMTYKCVDAKNLNNSLRMIKELRKRVTAREAHEKEIKSVVTQEKLILNKPGIKPPKLTEIFIRPNISGRRTAGALEAHKNGLRFTASKGSQVDILYKNVKHAFLQPAEHEMLVLIHFHLHDGIMVGKKKTSDVQFYTEVMELSHALDGGGKRSMYDADEIEDEQRERELRQRMNDEFQKFVRKVEEASAGELEFDIPYRDLGFHGVPHRSSVFMQPTVNCLVHLTEPPFCVVTLAEVEVASLERVQFSLKNFDLVFIFKNFSFTHINTIPIDSLETIKEWLDSCNIKYYESPQNLNWSRITTHIKENPEEFYKDGGFEFLSSDNEDGDEEESESDESFKSEGGGSGSDAGSDDESEDEEYAEDASDDDDEPEGDDESDEDAPSWDELERDAAKADKERGHIDEDAPRVKRKGEYSDDENDRKKVASKPKPAAAGGASKPKSSAPSSSKK